ncbi:Hypothetical predicted protein [Cloeon dipterum]|uniref:Uncharacterized protein n=1 Tax=Cloeon dipterum TaxID=197152 RepID=A0A8S1CZJ0_9INSE|nr:Hypothetical predicted protein [Cloeon dipterum]
MQYIMPPTLGRTSTKAHASSNNSACREVNPPLNNSILQFCDNVRPELNKEEKQQEVPRGESSMRLLLRRGHRRRNTSSSSGGSPTSANAAHPPGDSSWENTRSCPGSLKCHRRELSQQRRGRSYACGLKRHSSDPGSLKSRSPSPAAVEASRRFHAGSPTNSVVIEVHHDESRWSLYKPSEHWDEMFDPSHAAHSNQDTMEPTFNMKQLLEAGRPRSRLRVNRSCKPISGIRSTLSPTTITTTTTTTTSSPTTQ